MFLHQGNLLIFFDTVNGNGTYITISIQSYFGYTVHSQYLTVTFTQTTHKIYP